LQSNKHYLLFLLLLIIGGISGHAQEDRIVALPIKVVQDTIIAPLFTESDLKSELVNDSTKVDTVKTKPPLLLDIIKYKA